VFGSQEKSLEQASLAFRSLAESMDKAERGHGRLGSVIDSLKSKYTSLTTVANDFSKAVGRLSSGDIGGAAKAGKSALGGAIGATGLSTGALMLGGAVAGAAMLTVPGAAAWEQQVSKASKTALTGGGQFSKQVFSGEMLQGYLDVTGATQEGFAAAVKKAGSMGYKNEEAIKAATVGAKAGVAFGTDAEETMRMLGVVNQMWEDQAEAIGGNIAMMEKAGSAVNVLGNKYNATQSNILQFLSEAGGLAKVWNMDVAQTAAVGTMFETVGIGASEGESMLRTTLNAGLLQESGVDKKLARSLRKIGVRKIGKNTTGADIAAQLLGVSSKEYKKMMSENLADTLLATTDVILEKTQGDSALAQELSETIFGARGQGWLKLGGQRENLAAMTEESKKGFESGTALNKRPADLLATFGETMKLLGALGNVIGSFFLPPLTLLLSVFNALLGPVVKFAIVLHDVFFKQLDKIWGKFANSTLGKDLANAFGVINDALGEIWETVGPAVMDLLEAVLDVISGPVMIVLWGIVAIYDKIRPYIVKAIDFLSDLVDKFKGLWNWLMAAIPGAEKSAVAGKIKREAEKYDLVFNEVSGEFVNAKGNIVSPPSSRVAEMVQDWRRLPGFAEGIAQAVAAGLSGLGDSIAGAITGAISGIGEDIAKAITDMLPDFQPLQDAIESFNSWIEKLLSPVVESGVSALNWAGGVLNLGGSNEGEPPIVETERGKIYKTAGGEGVDVQFSEAYGNWQPGSWARGLSEGSLPVLWVEGKESEYKPPVEGHATGVTFSRTGYYTGLFHGPEEVLSRATTIKGPGIIDRALNALGSATSSNTYNRQTVSTEVHLHNENKFDFAGARFDSNFDTEAFLKKIDDRIKTVSVEAAKTAIGNRRT